MNVNVTDIRIDPMRQNGETEAPILSDQVRIALNGYFSRLDGHSDCISGLHAMVLSEVERPLIQTVLEHCGHNQSKTAQMLGVSRSTLRKKIIQYGLQ
jgi:Fis family transcriptional regulator, factor for inversion stimulation protein